MRILACEKTALLDKVTKMLYKRRLNFTFEKCQKDKKTDFYAYPIVKSSGMMKRSDLRQLG